MIKKAFKWAAGASTLAAAMSIASIGYAQSAVAEQTAGNEGGLTDIVVTAQKRQQSAQDVPIAVTALSGAQLAERGIVDVRDLAKASPGVLISEYGGSPSVTSINIRGVAQLDLGDHQEAPNALYVDGAYVSFVGATGASMFDVEGVEILRGPQGTLFGRNATGGLVQINSRKPTDELDGYMQASYGSYNRLNLEGALGGPLGGGFSARGAFSYNRQDGYYKNRLGPDMGEDETLNARLHLQYEFSPDTKNLLTAFYSRSFPVASGAYIPTRAVINPATGLTEPSPGGQPYVDFCTANGFAAPPPNAVNCGGYVRPANFDSWDVETPWVGTFSRKLFGLTNTFTTRLPFATLTSITNYFEMKKAYTEEISGGPVALVGSNAPAEGHQFSQELRLNGSTSRLEWVLGAFAMAIRSKPRQAFIFGDFNAMPQTELGTTFSQKTETYALFGQAEYKLTNQLSVIAGLRGNIDIKEIDVAGYSCDSSGCSSAGSEYSGRDKREAWSGRLQLTYKFNRDAMIYAGVNRGNKGAAYVVGYAPPAPGTPFNTGLIKPAVLTSYEAGFKTSWFDNRLRFNANAFYYDYSNMQAYKALGPGALTLFNAKARSYGGEIELVARPMRYTTLSAGLSLLNAKVKDVELPNGQIRDQKAPFAPDTSFNASLTQEIPTDIGTFSATGGARYSSSHYTSSLNEPILLIKPYTVFDANISWTSNDEKTSLSASVANITNKQYRVYGFSLGSFGSAIFNYGAPRWVNVKLTRKF